jgi:hypothetical protein
MNRSVAGMLSTLVLALIAIQPSITAAGDWQFSKIDECPYTAQYNWSSIRLDSGGRAQVLFQRDSNHSSGLGHACFQGDAWKIQEIERDCSVIGMHFVLDSADHSHVLYSAFNCKDEGLKYASLDGKTWKKSTIYNRPNPSEEEMMRRFGCNRYSLNLMVSDANDITVDRSGGVHLVYVDPEAEQLVYGYCPRDGEQWEWETLEKVGNHRLSASRINPVVAVCPTGGIWIAYKRYTQNKTDSGANTVHIDLRLAVKTGREWKSQTVVERLGFIDGQSHIMFGETNQSLIAYTRCAAHQPGAPSVKWLLLQFGNGKWIERYEGEPREQLLAVSWLGNRFHMVMTRVRPDRPNDGTILQDTLVRLRSGDDWKWKTDNLLELKDRRALAATMNRHGDLHVLFASSLVTSSTLECGVLKTAEADRQQSPGN